MTRTSGTSRHASPQLLLASQLIFNVGFYSVIPFLAITMRQDFQLGAMAIGFVLGARTFAQQGLFLLGGGLSDRWGPQRTMVTGCLIRVSGYLLLALAADFPLFLLGAILTGIGGALFSPALESLIAAAEKRRKASLGNRPTLFAWLVIVGELGAVTGPMLGSALLGIGFDVALICGAVVFTVMAGVFWRFLPTTTAVSADGRAPTGGAAQVNGSRDHESVWRCLGEKRFVGFAIFYGMNLVAHNQLYFGLPIEMERSGSRADTLGMLFAYASVLTIALQWPIARAMRRFGTGQALILGLGIQAVGFAAVAVLVTQQAAEGLEALPAVVLVTAVSLGHMCVAPTAMTAVLHFASGRPTGAYYGLLASCGGAMTLLANIALAVPYERAAATTLAATMPWLLLAVAAGISAVAIRRFLPAEPGRLDSEQIAQPVK